MFGVALSTLSPSHSFLRGGCGSSRSCGRSRGCGRGRSGCCSRRRCLFGLLLLLLFRRSGRRCFLSILLGGVTSLLGRLFRLLTFFFLVFTHLLELSTHVILHLIDERLHLLRLLISLLLGLLASFLCLFLGSSSSGGSLSTSLAVIFLGTSRGGGLNGLAYTILLRLFGCLRSSLIVLLLLSIGSSRLRLRDLLLRLLLGISEFLLLRLFSLLGSGVSILSDLGSGGFGFHVDLLCICGHLCLRLLLLLIKLGLGDCVLGLLGLVLGLELSLVSLLFLLLLHFISVLLLLNHLLLLLDLLSLGGRVCLHVSIMLGFLNHLVSPVLCILRLLHLLFDLARLNLQVVLERADLVLLGGQFLIALLPNFSSIFLGSLQLRSFLRISPGLVVVLLGLLLHILDILLHLLDLLIRLGVSHLVRVLRDNRLREVIVVEVNLIICRLKPSSD